MTNNWAKWDAEHGAGGGGVSSADKIAASIRESLGHGGADAHKTVETRGRGGSVVSRAEGARSVAHHTQQKDLKRPAPVKGEKDAADSFRTRIRMAEYNRKKKAAVAQDPTDKHTPHTEVVLNPHQPMGLSAKAHETTKAAEFSPSVQTHHAAAKAHLYAASAALALGKKQAAADHQHQAHQHLTAASLEVKHGPTLAPSHLKKLRDTASAASKNASVNPSESAHRDAADAHAQASYAASAMGKPIIAKNHLKAAKAHSVSANKIAASTKPGSSSGRIASIIKSIHGEHKTSHPSPVVYAPGSLEDLANKAEAATEHARAHPTPENHKLAAEAHLAATKSGTAINEKASNYHHQMAGYHNFAATKPDSVIPAGVHQEHVAEGASRFPGGLHHMFSSFMDTVTRRRSQKMYDSVPKASDSPLTLFQRKSISSYTGSAYNSINGHLRGTSPASGGHKTDIEAHVSSLDSAFAKQPGLKDDLITYRGVSSPDKLFGGLGEKVGGEFQDLGYGSTATHADVTAGFGSQSGALIRILHPKGSKVLKPSDIGMFGDHERELLVPRGARFHVAADRMVTQHNGTQRRMIDLIRQ